MPQPRFLQIEWSATAERQLAAAYVRATRTGVVPAANASPVTSQQIIDDVTEFERLCHEDWARHRDVLIGEQDPNKSLLSKRSRHCHREKISMASGMRQLPGTLLSKR